jgi:hypothetical protein
MSLAVCQDRENRVDLRQRRRRRGRRQQLGGRGERPEVAIRARANLGSGRGGSAA